MADSNNVVDKVAARISLDVSPALQQLKQLSDALDSTVGKNSALTRGATSSGDMFLQGANGAIRNLKQSITDLQLSYKEGALSAEQFYQKLADLRNKYAGAFDLTTSTGLANDTALRKALVQAQNDLSSFQDFQMTSEDRLNAQKESMQAASIDREMKQIKDFYTLRLTSAEETLTKLEDLMNQEADYFITNQDKQIQAMKMAQKVQSDMVAQYAAQDRGATSSAAPKRSSYGGGFHIGVTSMAEMMLEFSGLNEIFKNVQAGIVDVSKSAAGLQQVFGDNIKSQQQLTQVTDEFIGIAQEYGTTVSSVLDAGKQWGRQYKDVATALTLTRNATLLATVDNLQMADANKAVEATMNSMGMAATNQATAYANSMKIVDSWSALAHEASVSASDLAMGVERAGGAAHQAGVSLDQLNALIAAGVRNTGLSGDNIGNMWKTVLANISAATPKVQNAFKQLGISMTEVGANGQQQMKPVWELLMELSDAAQHATTNQAAYFRTISGGVQQYSKFMSALSDTQTIQDDLTKSMNSNGKASRYVSEQIDTLKLNLQRLQDAIQKVSYDVSSDQGLGKVINGLVVGITDLINGLEKLPSWFDWTAASAIGLLTAGKLLTSVMNAFKDIGNMVTLGLKFWGNTLNTVVTSVDTLAGATVSATADLNAKVIATEEDIAATEGQMAAAQMATIALEEEGVAAQTAGDEFAFLDAMSGGLALAVGVVATAIVGVIGYLGATSNASQDASQSAQQLTNTLQQQTQQMQSNQSQTVQNVNALEGLKEKYIEVHQTLATAKKGSQEYNQAEQTVLEIENQLISIVGQRAATQILSSKDVVAAINAERKAMIENEITTEQEFIAKQQASAAATQKVISDTENRITALMTEINALQAAAQAEEALSKQYAVGSLAYEEHLSNQMLDNQKVDSVKSTLSDLDKQIAQQEGKWNSVQHAISGANDRITQLKNNLKELSINPNGILNDVATPSGGTLGSGGSSSGKKSGSSGSSGSALSQYVQPFKDLTQSDDAALKPFQAHIDAIANSLQSFKDSMSAARSALQQNMSDTKAAADYAAAYGNTVKETTSHENALASQNWESSQLMKQLSRDIANVNAQYKAGRITAQEHRDALSTLSQEYDRLSKSIQSNDKAILQDQKDMASATQDMRDEITSMLKSAYDEEKTVQEDALQNIYQPQIDALTQQKDAVDALIQSLQQQWQMQSQVNQLTDLQNQLAAVKADTSFRVVNTDGSVSWTYDQSKAADLQKQIADQQTKIAHDAEIQQLQDQKNSLDQQIKDLQSAYDQKKKALDDYWAYRTSQDQLNSEADRLIMKDGYTKSLQDAQTFVQQMNTIYSQLQMPGITTGGAVSAGLSQVNAGTPQLSPYWQGVANKGYETVAGMTPSQIAAKYGVDPNSLTKLSNGEYSIPWSQLQNYAFQQSGINTPTFSAPTPSFSSFSNVASSSSNTTNITKNVTIPIANVNVNNQSDIDSLIDAIHSAV